MSSWSTRAQAIGELRAQMQDEAAPQRYTDAELGKAVDEAVAGLSIARPILSTVRVTLDSTLVVRLDTQIGPSLFGSITSVVDVTDPDDAIAIFDYYYYEQAGQHKVIFPRLASGEVLEIGVRGAYGFAIATTIGGAPVTIDTNIPAEWRESLIEGAQGYALELYGAREVGRTSVAPAVAQQTARAAAVKLRDFRQWLQALPFADGMRQVVVWGLKAADAGDF